MHTYIHTYVRTYIHTYMHKYIHTYIHTSIHTSMHACIHIFIYACMYIYMGCFFGKWFASWVLGYTYYIYTLFSLLWDAVSRQISSAKEAPRLPKELGHLAACHGSCRRSGVSRGSRRCVYTLPSSSIQDASIIWMRDFTMWRNFGMVLIPRDIWKAASSESTLGLPPLRKQYPKTGVVWSISLWFWFEASLLAVARVRSLGH